MAVSVPRPPSDFWPKDSWRDRITERFGERRPIVGALIAIVIALVVVVSIAYQQFGDDLFNSPTDMPEVAQAQTPRSKSVRFFVHVAGAVTEPGVFELVEGKRVIDAVEMAGGAVAEADLNQVNLAAEIKDGSRIYIPRVGELPAPTNESGDLGAAGAQLNLNTATKTQLETLPGIGPELAEAIVDQRDKMGGFNSVDDLRSVRGIGEKRFADLKDQVTL